MIFLVEFTLDLHYRCINNVWVYTYLIKFCIILCMYCRPDSGGSRCVIGSIGNLSASLWTITSRCFRMLQVTKYYRLKIVILLISSNPWWPKQQFMIYKMIFKHIRYTESVECRLIYCTPLYLRNFNQTW